MPAFATATVAAASPIGPASAFVRGAITFSGLGTISMTTTTTMLSRAGMD